MENRRRQRLQILTRLGSDAHGDLLGSDVRVNGGVLGDCPLCAQRLTLRLSHIVPRWMYRFAKAEGVMFGVYPSLGVLAASQDGEKHYLLCDSCEQYLGVAENYLQTLMHGRAESRSAAGIQPVGEAFDGVDYRTIQRALLGILFKAHYAPAPPFHTISLSAELVAAVRDALVHGASVPLRIIAMRFETIEPGIDPRAVVIAKWSPRTQQLPAYFALLAAAWEWVLFVGDGTLPDEFAQAELRCGEQLWVPLGEFTEHRFVLSVLEHPQLRPPAEDSPRAPRGPRQQ